MLFDRFDVKKSIAPLADSLDGNRAAINALTAQASLQFEQVSLQFEQAQRAQKELSLQIEELYDRVTDPAPVLDCDAEQLVGTAVSVRDELEHLRAYTLSRGDEELNRQIELLLLICDRKLSEAGISRIERTGKTYDWTLDAVSDVEHMPDIENGVITKVLSGCYKYRGFTVKRANVIVNKGASYE
jgi:molecular chaperone GrpE (heat shock protein)